MLRLHRTVAMLLFPLIAYIVITGAGIQFWDMQALLTHAPASDPEMQTMREHVYGTPNFAVVSPPDYSNRALPNAIDLPTAVQRVALLGRMASPGATLRMVEIRTAGGVPAGHVRMDDKHYIFDLNNGARLPEKLLPPPQPGPEFRSNRKSFKNFHRFNFLGLRATLINFIAGFGIAFMVFTGLRQYWTIYKLRAKMGRKVPFWPGGIVRRKTHRWLSLIAAVPVLWIAASGIALSIDNMIPGFEGLPDKTTDLSRPNGFSGDFSSPLRDDELNAMTRNTIAAYTRDVPGVGIKVLNLRYFAGYSQGVVIAADAGTTQYVFNTRTRASMSMSEPGYPSVIFPTGWELHQRLKRIHRGDILGMPGRWVVSFGAASLIYLLFSGVAMYYQISRRSQKIR